MADHAQQPQKILIADPQYATFVPEVARDFPNLELMAASAGSDATALTAPDIVGLIVQSATVDSTLLTALPNLQVLLKNGRSYHNIDMDAARTAGLTIACLPRKGPNCVAELALTLILALSKDLLVSHESVADGAYRLRGLKPEKTAERKISFHWMKNALVHEVVDKTLGIIGMGEIGCELARRVEVLGMRTVYHKRSPLSPELERRFNASYRSREQLLRESDYVCIALPHTPESERLIGPEELELMKPTAYLVNVARGGIVDEDALITALSTQRIAGAGLDVFTYEPLPVASPLCALDNVILTPHIGGGTGTTWALELRAAVEEMARILAGAAPRIDISRP